MSLLMDALKKAENAKKQEDRDTTEREKQKGSAEGNDPANTASALSADSPLETFAAESTSAGLTLEELDDTSSESHKDTPAADSSSDSDDSDFIFSLDNSEQAAEPENNNDASVAHEDHKVTQQLNAPELTPTKDKDKDKDKEASPEANLGATMQINVPDALRLASNAADEINLATLESSIASSVHDASPASSKLDNSDATLEAIEDLFNNAPPATEPLPEEKLPLIDYEALAALKSEHQVQAQQMFKGNKQPGNNASLLLWSTVAILLIAIIVIAVWYFWTISELQTETQLATPAQQTEAMPAAQEIAGTQSAATNPQDVVTIAAVDDPRITPQAVPANLTEAPAMAPATPPASNTEFPASTDESDNGSAITIKKGATTSRIDKRLRKAWNDFQQGDTDRAEKTYRKILEDEPLNRDALLGKAAIALRHNDLGSAHQLYNRLLQRDPQDALAQSALISLLGRQDPVAGISRINLLLEKNPKAPWLHFALGNLYAQQTRWIESQQAYFHAWTLDQNNPDYAYNLAIAMDHLGKQKQALNFYQRAMDLAESRPISFPTGQVIQRINSIKSTQ